MSDPFLALPGTKRKRPSRTGRPVNPSSESRGPRPQRKDKSTFTKKRRLRDRGQDEHEDDDDEIGAGAIDSDATIEGDEVQSEEERSDVEESAADKRLRFAKAYLEQVRSEVGIPPPSTPSSRASCFRSRRGCCLEG